MCGERTANPFVALIWPRCRVCRSRFRVELPFGLKFVGHYAAQLVLVASIVAAVMRRDTSLFTVGFFVFVVVEIAIFWIGRLAPDTRDPITVMQQRRYDRG